jgi:DNA gyrase subunit B
LEVVVVVKVVGEKRKRGVDAASRSLFEDPDPQQLVMAWDEKARAPQAAARKRGAEKAAPKSKKAAGEENPTTKAPRATKKDAPAKTETMKAASTRNHASAETRERAQDVGRGTSPRRPAPAQPLRQGEAPAEPKEGRGSRRAAASGGGARALRSQATSVAPAPEQPKRARKSPGSSLEAQEAALAVANGHRHGNGDGASSAAYTGEQIQILEGVQHIRQRPGMYIGGTSTSGLLHLIYEAVDNVVDEFNAGHGSHMWIAIDRDGRVTVRDEARGIPIDPKEWSRVVLPAATWIFIKPFTGGKFEQGAYKQAGGLHGVGLTVINALSAELEVDIWRDGQHFQQRFREGEALSYTLEPCDPSLHGTQIRWLPDPSIFDEDATYDVETLLSRLEATACLNGGLRIEVSYWDEDAKEQLHKVLHSKHGLADYVRRLAAPGSNPLFRQPVSIAKVKDDVSVEVVLLPDDGYKTQLFSFANGVRTPDGGTHETGFKAALTKMVNDYAAKWSVIKDRSKDALKPDVIQQGLVAVISVKLADPQFQGQTKNRLNNAPVDGIVRSVVSEGLTEWFETNQAPAKEWFRKIHLAQKARNEAQMAEELARTGQKKNGELIDVSLSRKFAACNGNDPARNELFLVEGESAGGSAKQARRSEFQAILALKGKPLNVANASLQRILDNEEIRTIISVIGTGTRHMFDIERLKFHKIIILSDADVDGSHIICLLLTLFHQEMPGLIENGNVYLGCPPLYSVKYKNKTVWLIDDEARKKFLRQHPDASGLEFKRYKGLGEMNAPELRETTMDPSRRVLRRVTMEDTLLAAKLVNDLMARENAEARRALLARQAKHLAAGNLDV